MGGGGVCELAGKSCGNGLAFCYQHWTAGRAAAGDSGGMLCETKDCGLMATTLAGRRAIGGPRLTPMAVPDTAYWCDDCAQAHRSQGYTTRSLKHAQ